MKTGRAGGVLLHPTSLPGPFGIGDLGPAARAWIDFLVDSGCGLWQVLPLGPTGYADSPYQALSSWAMNPLLISPESLVGDGLLEPSELADRPRFPEERVEFQAVAAWKQRLLERAFERFRGRADLRSDFDAFRAEQAGWLDDFVLYMAVKEAHGGGPWVDWPAPIRRRDGRSVGPARRRYAPSIDRAAFAQWVAHRQWAGLRSYAHSRGIRIIGDIPIFVAHDSAEVWANPELFTLGTDGHPEKVAGVPPDYFSATGQLWGNPLYQWERHAADGYRWWLSRLVGVLDLVDIVRIDHFRGFAGFWEIPGDADTAVYGRWVPGPGREFFTAIRRSLGDLPIIAEDLGEITPDVIELRDEFALPGMKVLQFAFTGEPDNEFLPHTYVPHCVVYTGTHDNDTTWGWFRTAPAVERQFCTRYLDRDGADIAWDLIRLAWSSVAELAVTPMQDLLDLGTEARMNYPGRMSGNWQWRMPAGAVDDADLRDRLRELNVLYDRFTPRPDRETGSSGGAGGSR